jgi:hypothetical protein
MIMVDDGDRSPAFLDDMWPIALNSLNGARAYDARFLATRKRRVLVVPFNCNQPVTCTGPRRNPFLVTAAVTLASVRWRESVSAPTRRGPQSSPWTLQICG